MIGENALVERGRATDNQRSSMPKIDYTIEKLDSTNFITWRWQMKNILRSKGLLEVVEPDFVEVNEESKNKNLQTMVLLGGSLDKTNVTLVVGCESAKEIWKKLAVVYENKTAFVAILQGAP